MPPKYRTQSLNPTFFKGCTTRIPLRNTIPPFLSLRSQEYQVSPTEMLLTLAANFIVKPNKQTKLAAFVVAQTCSRLLAGETEYKQCMSPFKSTYSTVWALSFYFFVFISCSDYSLIMLFDFQQKFHSEIKDFPAKKLGCVAVGDSFIRMWCQPGQITCPDFAKDILHLHKNHCKVICSSYSFVGSRPLFLSINDAMCRLAFGLAFFLLRPLI